MPIWSKLKMGSIPSDVLNSSLSSCAETPPLLVRFAGTTLVVATAAMASTSRFVCGGAFSFSLFSLPPSLKFVRANTNHRRRERKTYFTSDIYLLLFSFYLSCSCFSFLFLFFFSCQRSMLAHVQRTPSRGDDSNE